jgi:hypothetical protein
MGFSYCLPQDTFVKDFGRKIAVGRMEKVQMEFDNQILNQNKPLKFLRSRSRKVAAFTGSSINDIISTFNNMKHPKSFIDNIILANGVITWPLKPTCKCEVCTCGK